MKPGVCALAHTQGGGGPRLCKALQLEPPPPSLPDSVQLVSCTKRRGGGGAEGFREKLKKKPQRDTFTDKSANSTPPMARKPASTRSVFWKNRLPTASSNAEPAGRRVTPRSVTASTVTKSAVLHRKEQQQRCPHVIAAKSHQGEPLRSFRAQRKAVCPSGCPSQKSRPSLRLSVTEKPSPLRPSVPLFSTSRSWCWVVDSFCRVCRYKCMLPSPMCIFKQVLIRLK